MSLDVNKKVQLQHAAPGTVVPVLTKAIQERHQDRNHRFKDDENGKSGIAYLHQTAPEGSVATIPSSAIHTAGQGPLCSELSHQ